MKKKVLVPIILVVVLVVSGVLIADHFKVRVPQIDAGVGVWESEQRIVANPGGFEIATLTLLNGKDMDRVFYVTLQQPNPNKLPDGYEAFPEEYYDWFTMPEEGIPIKAGGYYQLKIPILVPYTATCLGRNMELKVQAIGFDGTGFAQLGVASIWYITVVATEE